jgi:PAS domain S-box-containing protein
MSAGRENGFEALWEDGERLFCRAWRKEELDGEPAPVLAVVPNSDHPSANCLERLTHEYGLKEELDSAWAARPLELVREQGRLMLLLEDPGGEPLERLLGAPMELGKAVRLGLAIAVALAKLHSRDLVHKDLTPAHVLVSDAGGHVRLTGFGLASRLPRERQTPEPPETIAGTLAYMAPEQTGRMNRSIDARSDLYALGVILYQMLTGSLPFAASDPMEWVHCHIARRAVPPGERQPTVPAVVSALVMKLLAKTAEDRYQTATGVAGDLRRCLAEWERRHRIDDFPLGDYDTPDRLLIPEKLYGRAREIEALLAALDRALQSGEPALVLVSGPAGIGKSSVVYELHKALVPSRGQFAAGKVDQYKRDIPYAMLAQAFQSLIRSVLGKNDVELAGWRDALQAALGMNGRLMIELVPELKLVIGEQPPVPPLPLQDAQRRFRLVLRRFISVFARPDHPLVLFLDDLQWLDAATLDLLEDLLTRPDTPHLLLIGACRSNDGMTDHPLRRQLDAIRQAGARIEEIGLAPLDRDDLGRLISDALRCAPERAAPLAQLVHEKTAGNPFFATQFLHALAEEGVLRFDHDTARWCWELDRRQARSSANDVADLMAAKLSRLPARTQRALQQLACLGDTVAITLLPMVLESSTASVHSALREAVRLDLVEHVAGGYRFVHDRVQEAAYSLIPEASRAAAHLRIGRLLAAHTPATEREKAIFEIVNQLNRGSALIASRDEREQLAELNLAAGKRAKASAAYASALTYLAAGAALLPENRSDRRPELAFQLELYRAECEFLTGALAAAEERLAALSTGAATAVERANVACLRIDLYTTLDLSDRAIDVGLDYLRHLGIDWSPHPTAEEARGEYERIWSRLGGRAVEALVDLPLMEDPGSLATLDVLTRLLPPALFTDMNLFILTICRAVNLSLERGNCDGSCVAYVRLGMIAGPRFGNYEAGIRFGLLGYDLVERRGLKRFEAATCMLFGAHIAPWTRHVQSGRGALRRAFDIANKTGDVTFAAYSCGNLNANLLAAGDPLAEVQREAESGLDFAQKMRFGFVIDRITTQLAVVRMLRGLTRTFGVLDDEQFNELQIERRLSGNLSLALPECWYWIRKLQARFLAGDYAAAFDAAARAERLLWTLVLHWETAEYHFYGALCRAALCDGATVGERQRHLEAISSHHRQLEAWAENCPENFENRAALVGAEIAGIEGRDLDAMRLYEQAIRSAHANGFIHNEALANERAAHFYAARGFDKIARAYLRDARGGYLRWGADGKVRQLEEAHPYLRKEEPVPGPTGMIGAPVEHLDLSTVIKVSQAVSGEIVLERLVDTLMRVAIVQAGAERGLLIVPRAGEPRIEAEAMTRGDKIIVQLRDTPVIEGMLPESLLHYVLRTREGALLEDAVAQNPFAADPYFRRGEARSVLCLPLITQAKLIGVLYLENNLVPRVFAPTRIPVLKVLASQAAVSLENARLYRDLAEREGKIRRLVDANIIGILIWDGGGKVVEANDAFLNMVGYDREDLASGRMRWLEITAPESREATLRAQAQLKATGICQPYEKAYLRKDGSRVPALVGGAAYEGSRNQGVTFVLDLTERKQAEGALRESEERFRTLVQFSFDVYWESDAQHRFTRQEFADGLADAPAPGSELGRTRWEVPYLEPDEEAWRKHRETLDAHLPFRDFELARPTPDGGKRYVSVSGLPVFDQAGRFVGYRGVGRHITERKRAEEAQRVLQVRLQQASKMEAIGRLAGGIAHDFNNILGAAINFARFLEEDLPPASQQHHFARRLVNACTRGKDLVAQILAFAMARPLDRRSLDLRDVLRDARELLVGTLPATTRLDLSLGAAPLVVSANESQLGQVVVNLCINAQDALRGHPGEIAVSLTPIFPGAADYQQLMLLGGLEAGQPYARIDVADTGEGIPAATLPQIFEPFFTTKERGRGTGLGLAVVHRIITAHEGACAVASAPARGTRFSIYLPLEEGAADEGRPTGPENAQECRGSERVLVVDDEIDIADALSIGLERLGYEVATVNDPLEALAAVREDPQGWGVVVTDYLMPGLDGLGLAQALGAVRPDLPVILYTGVNDEAIEAAARDRRIAALVRKSAEAAELARSIRAVMREPAGDPA